MSRILVTGGAGYIGSVVCELLLQHGHQVKVIDLLWFKKDVPLAYLSNPNYKFVYGDISNSSLIEEELRGIDFVIHAAAVVGEPASRKYPELTNRVNYEASVNLMKKAQQLGIKGFIFLSTCSNYGISSGVACEDTALNPLSLYARTKVSAERHLCDSCGDLDWIICRLSTVYGISPRMRFDLTVNDFTMKAFLDKYIDIFLPYTYRPYINVHDAAEVILKMLEQFNDVKNNVFNVGCNTQNYQKIQIAEAIKRFIPDLKIEILRKGADVRDYKVDFSRINRCLGFKNTYTIEDSVDKLLVLLNSGTFGNLHNRIYYNTQALLGEKNGIRAGCP